MKPKPSQEQPAPDENREAQPARPAIHVLDLRTTAARETVRGTGVLDFASFWARLRTAWRDYRTEQGVEYYEDSTYIHAVHDEFFIVCDYRDSRLYQYGYTVDADGNVSITGPGQEVIVTYLPVNVGQPVRSLLERLSKADDETIRGIAELADDSETVRGTHLSKKAKKYVRGKATKMRSLLDEVEAFLDADDSEDDESRGEPLPTTSEHEAELARKAALDHALGEETPPVRASTDELLNIVRGALKEA